MANLTITTSSVVPGSAAILLFDHAAGAEITAGQAVYLDDSSLWQLLDADNATGTEITRTIGIAMNHAYTGQKLTVNIRDTDLTIGATVTAGSTYFGSTTPGAICPFADLASGDYPVTLFIAKSSTNVNLNPSAAGAAI